MSSTGAISRIFYIAEKMLCHLTEPTLLLDEKKCRQNIQRMADRARRFQIDFRPHFKTHQSREIGRWFRDTGVDRITVSSVRMAHYFAQDGWRDITIAFPTNLREIQQINALLYTGVTLELLADQLETITYLDQHLIEPVGIYIKINTGNMRVGLQPHETQRLDQIVELITESSRLHLVGLLGHAGHSYDARSHYAINLVHEESVKAMDELRQRYRSQHPDLIVSLGDTPGCSISENFEGVDEMRPGNFVFYDLMQAQITACSPEEIAVVMACPVIAKYPERREIAFYGGAIHFSKDRLHSENGDTYYGLPVRWTDGGWELDEVGYVRKLSQEHGILRLHNGNLDAFQVGDMIGILPVHSCLTANLMKGYRTLQGRRIGMMQ